MGVSSGMWYVFTVVHTRLFHRGIPTHLPHLRVPIWLTCEIMRRVIQHGRHTRARLLLCVHASLASNRAEASTRFVRITSSHRPARTTCLEIWCASSLAVCTIGELSFLLPQGYKTTSIGHFSFVDFSSRIYCTTPIINILYQMYFRNERWNSIDLQRQNTNIYNTALLFKFTNRSIASSGLSHNFSLCKNKNLLGTFYRHQWWHRKIFLNACLIRLFFKILIVIT